MKMSEKTANLQRKPLKGLRKTWKTVDEDHFKNYKDIIQIKSGSLEAKYKGWKRLD